MNSGGKEFCLKFASIFDRHSPNRFSAIPYNNDGERLIMIGERTKEDLEHSQDIDLMAGGLGAILSENEQTAKAGVAITVKHQAIDVTGTAKVNERAPRLQTPHKEERTHVAVRKRG